MKKQINPTIKAHLIRGAFYLLLLLAVCAIPFALAQRNASKQSAQMSNGTATMKVAGASTQGAAPASLAGRTHRFDTSQAQFVPFDFRPNVAVDSVLNHVQLQPARTTKSHTLVRPRQTEGIDCNNEPGIVIQDDGTLENGYSGNPAAGVTEVRVVDKFTPTSYPASYSSVCLDFVTVSGGPPTYNIDVVVYDDDGAGGSPGTLLGSLNAQSATTHLYVNGEAPIWNSYDISSLGLNITSGSVYIGARWMPPAINVYMSADESTAHPIGFAGGYFWDNIDNAWFTTQTFFPNYRACMIRPVQTGGGGGTPTPTATATPTCPPGFSENFDGVTPPSLPPDWMATQGVNQGGFPFWETSASGTPTPVADSPPNSVYSVDPANLLDNRLDTPTIMYGAGSQLTFRANYDLEQSDATTAFDCGVLEISVDNGATYQDIIAAGGSFVTGGYNHTAISTSFMNPCLPSRSNWSGISNGGSGGFQTTTVNLPASGVGQQVKLRWRMCSDNSVSHAGWRVDNVAISGPCGTPTPTPTASPTATPSCTPTVVMGSIDSSDPTQNDRLFRSAIPQTCPATTSCAVFGDGQQHHYDSYTFQNTTGSTQCVTVDTNTACTGTNFIFTAAYLGSFDPNNICTNWIGDSGGSPNPDQPFQVEVADGQTMVVVVSEVTANAGCAGYTVTITGLCGGGGGTPTPTPTASPSCTAGGTPGPWTAGSPYPALIVRYGFAQTAMHFYVFGGVDNGTRTNAVNRYSLATGMWESRASMPFASEAPTCALMESTGIVYCAEGDTGSGFASYNIATDTWTPLASIPGGDHYGSASGAFNGKVFVAGGTTSFSSAVQVYDVASNTWSAGTSAPAGYLLAGYHQVGQYLYVVGGWTGGAPTGLTTTVRLDMSSAPGVWENGPAFPMGRSDFGLAYDAGNDTLYALGGDAQGGAFFDSTNEVDELPLGAWPGGTWVMSPPNLPAPNRQANQAGFYGNGDIWSVGGLDGSTFQFLNQVWHRNNGGCGGASPTPTATFTPTATATATATFTPTATATATFTPTATATATATPTATATIEPRETPTPRPRPTPPPRPTP